MNTSSTPLAVLVSGTGSLLEAIIAAGIPIALVVADRECRGLAVAKAAGIPAELLERGDFGSNFDREGYTGNLTHLLDTHQISLIAMAGFMTFLSPTIFTHYAGRIINSHPALLPDFKGAHAVEDALAAGVQETGTTIHIATEKLDDGKILAQEKVPIVAGDTAETLHERIKEKERALYPKVLRDILSGAIVLTDN